GQRCRLVPKQLRPACLGGATGSWKNPRTHISHSRSAGNLFGSSVRQVSHALPAYDFRNDLRSNEGTEDKRLGDIPSSALHTLWQSNAVAQLARVLLPFASLLGPSSVVTDTSFQA
ncbi:unnamed protein product, partial [Mycena citricolor]